MENNTSRNPGQPLNPQNMPIAQGIPYDGIVIASHTVHVGNGQYNLNTPTLVPMQVEHAQYTSSDVPFQKLNSNYKP